jgi:mono/diheme cytochrome c family protein
MKSFLFWLGLTGLIVSMWGCGASPSPDTHDHQTVDAVTQPKPAAPADPEVVEGAKLYRQYCAACHKVNSKLIGPPMAGIHEKYADEMDWLYAYIRNSSQLVQEGDPKAVALYEEWDKQVMPPFPMLSDEQIDLMLKYIAAEAE